jgi:hypothetical protein
MIEKFLEKFLPQITQRVNENAELGQALIETLAVLDNYATLNNVQFTDEQVNAMLGIVPEPEPEPVVDIPAQIEEIVEKKKGSSKTKKWDWRFKTEQELRTDFPKLEWEGWWNNEKKYLSGQKIKFSAAGKKYFEDYVFTKKDASEVPVVDTKEYFGVTSDDDDVWTVVYQMVTQDPLPTELETTTPAAPDMFWGYIQDFNSRFPNKINSFELRYSYMTWEELMGYYEKADDKFKDEFIKSVYIVLRNSRLLTIYTETQVRQAILDNEPTPDMLELFSQNYYFSPPLVNFYLSNYYQMGTDRAIQRERTSKGIVTGTKLDDQICVSIDSEVLNTVNNQERGYCGLGSALSNNQPFYPDIITIDWTGAISKGYNPKKADNIGQVNLTQISQNAYYDSLIGLKSSFNNNEIISSFVPLAISYDTTAYEYQDIYQVKSDWIYIENSKSNLDSYISGQKLYGQNEYIFPPFLKNILEPICVLTDYDELVYQFEQNGFIDSQKASELLVIGNAMQFRGSGGENVLFFQCVVNNSLALTTTIRLTRKLKQFTQLDSKQEDLLYVFIELFFNKVVAPSSQFVWSEYKKKTEGATAQITPIPQPTATSSTWNWRFKTLDEFVEEYGDIWVDEVDWLITGEMDYLIGQEIAETTESKEVIQELTARKSSKVFNTFDVFRITSGGKDVWRINTDMLTNKPLSKVKLRRSKPITPPTSAWTWRIKTEDELIEEYGIYYQQEDWWSEGKDYLLGQPIIQTPESENFIQEYAITNQKIYERDDLKMINTEEVLGITSGDDDDWIVSYEFLTQKPLPTAVTPDTWTWRFKTEQEFIDDYGENWRTYDDNVEWVGEDRTYENMDFLLGQPIIKSPTSERIIKRFQSGEIEIVVDVEKYFGIKNPIISANKEFGIIEQFLTPNPLPTAAVPKKRGRKPKTAWSWRFKTEEEFENEYGEDWFENIGGTGVNWGTDMDEYNMSFLEGQPIKESADSRKMLEIMFKGNGNEMLINVKKYFGIQNPSLSGAKDFLIVKQMLTDEPLPQVSQTWNWRFKTEEELQQEFGLNLWKTVTAWNFNGDMDYLLGKPIIESDLSKQFIENLLQSKAVSIDTNKNLGIDSGSSNTWAIKEELVTNKPLPTAATPAKTPKKRGRKPKSELPDIDLGGLEDIGDIDINDIDFDNLVI